MTEVLLYGEVGWDFDAHWLQGELSRADGDVTLRVHSPGGDVFEGVAISNVIRHARTRGKRVTALVDGLAASAASYMCLTCDEVVAGPGAVFMVHPASALAYGHAGDLRKTAQALDTCDSTIRDLYRRKTGRDSAEVEATVDAETWFGADEAVEWGLADRLDPDAEVDLSGVDAKWSDVAAGAPYAAFAHANPGMGDDLLSHQIHAALFGRRLEEARRAGNPAACYARHTLPSKPDEGDGPVEATGPEVGEAPAYAFANGQVHRIGKRKE